MSTSSSSFVDSIVSLMCSVFILILTMETCHKKRFQIFANLTLVVQHESCAPIIHSNNKINTIQSDTTLFYERHSICCMLSSA